MSSSGIIIPKEYGYVAASIIPTVWLLMGQTLLVGRYRRRAGVPYPYLYADKAQAESSREAHLFNCAQRAHQNTLEAIPIAWAITLISGVSHPILASTNMLLYTISRVMYTRGYITGEPKKRVNQLSHAAMLGFFGLLASSTWRAGKLVYEGLSNYFSQ